MLLDLCQELGEGKEGEKENKNWNKEKMGIFLLKQKETIK